MENTEQNTNDNVKNPVTNINNNEFKSANKSATNEVRWNKRMVKINDDVCYDSKTNINENSTIDHQFNYNQIKSIEKWNDFNDETIIDTNTNDNNNENNYNQRKNIKSIQLLDMTEVDVATTPEMVSKISTSLFLLNNSRY